MKLMAVKRTEIGLEFGFGDAIENVDRGVKGCYGYVTEVEDDEDAGILIYVPGWSKTDFHETHAEETDAARDQD